MYNKRLYKFEVFCGENKEWYWRLRSGNGKIVAIAGEGYKRQSSAVRALTSVLRNADKTSLVVL